MKKYLFILISILVSVSGMAQRSQGGFPMPEKLPLRGGVLKSIVDEWVEMPLFDMSMVQQDSLQLRIGGWQFAHPFEVNLTPENSGIVSVLEDGTKVWRLKIRSLNALSVNLIFDKFHLEGEAKVFLYDPERQNVLGAFTSANNRVDSVFATTPIDGDEIVVEYVEPVGSSGVLSVGSVNHAFRDFRALPSFGRAASCLQDVSCVEGVNDLSRRSVAMLMINGSNMCSGSLINNTSGDGTPYFLTAAHCFTLTSSQKTSAELAETCVLYFNYESPHCFSSIQGTLEMSLSGATLVAMQSANDMVLLKLDEKPPLEYNTYYSGWNISESFGSGVYTVHHPQGDVKKYTTSTATPVKGTFTSSSIDLSKNVHWIVKGWENGVTEGGSSGAPLFDSEGHIIGSLTGGYEPSGCDEENRDAFYRINTVWKGRIKTSALSPFLDPNSSDATVFGGAEPYEYHCNRISNYEEGTALYESNKDEYVAGNNSLSINEYAERYETTGGTLYGAFFIPEYGKYSEDDEVMMNVYSGEDKPEKLLYQQRIRITDTHYSGSSFVTDTPSYYLSRDFYLHFDTPVTVDSVFFVSVSVPESPQNSFGIYATNGNSKNTAFFKQDGEWQPFTKHPIMASASSLMIEPQLLPHKFTSTKDVKAEQKTLVYPNPAQSEITLSFTERPLSVCLYNLQGVRLNSFTPNDLSYKIDLKNYPQGVYIIEVQYQNEIEKIKLLKQ